MNFGKFRLDARNYKLDPVLNGVNNQGRFDNRKGNPNPSNKEYRRMKTENRPVENNRDTRNSQTKLNLFSGIDDNICKELTKNDDFLFMEDVQFKKNDDFDDKFMAALKQICSRDDMKDVVKDAINGNSEAIGELKKKVRDYDPTRHQKKSNDEDLRASDVATINEFIKEYDESKMDYVACKTMIGERFGGITNIVVKRFRDYDNDVKSVVIAINRLVSLMSTTNFSVNLHNVMKEGNMTKTDNYFDNMKRLFSFVVDTNYNKLSSDVVLTYTNTFMECIAELDMKIMEDTYGMTDNTALDFAITIPCATMKNKYFSDVRVDARRFIEVTLANSDDTIKFMDAKCQKDIFYGFFNDDKGTMAIKAASQCLMDAPTVIPALDEEGNQDNNKVMLYDEYKKMLYQLVDEHDIPTIKGALVAIAKDLRNRESRHLDTACVFNIKDATEYTNIRKAFLDFGEGDEPITNILEETCK